MPRFKLALLAFSLAALAAAAVAAADTTLNLVAYSTPKPVLAQIIQDFQGTPAGQGISFTQSYGASTNQAKAIVAGQPADIVFLSTGDDMNQLVDAGIVDSSWDKQGYKGIAADTVVVFANWMNWFAWSLLPLPFSTAIGSSISIVCRGITYWMSWPLSRALIASLS